MTSSDPTDFLFARFKCIEEKFSTTTDPEITKQRSEICTIINSIRKRNLPESTLHDYIQCVYNVFPYECRITVTDPEEMQKSLNEAEERLKTFSLSLSEEDKHELFLDVKYLIDMRFFIIFRFENAMVDDVGIRLFNRKK